MTIDNVKDTISKLEFLCKSYDAPVDIKLEDVEEAVSHLSHEVQSIDIASDHTLKGELSVLERALSNLSLILKRQQDNIDYHVKELHLQQRALHAYAHVANNNFGSIG
jgi:hypothetical protein